MAKLKSELKKWPMGKPDNYNEEEEAELKKERMAKQEEEIEARTEQLKDEYSKKLAHLQSLILRATGDCKNGNNASSSSSMLFGGRRSNGSSGHRDTWGPGEIRKCIVDRHRRTSLGRISEDDEDVLFPARSSDESVTSVVEDMTLNEAYEEIVSLRERLSNEEENLFDCENELSDLARDYALLTEGIGIEKKDLDELKHMESIYENGLVRVMKERYRQKMMERENRLKEENNKLRDELLNMKRTRDQYIHEKLINIQHENTQLRNINTNYQMSIEQLQKEKIQLSEQNILMKEQCDREVDAIKHQVFEHEKFVRAEAKIKSMTPTKDTSTRNDEDQRDENKIHDTANSNHQSLPLQNDRKKYQSTPASKKKRISQTPLRDLFKTGMRA
jgi:hypothetical protein